MDIHGGNVSYIEFKVLEFHNFTKNDQIAAKLCRAFFPHKINKKMKKKQG